MSLRLADGFVDRGSESAGVVVADFVLVVVNVVDVVVVVIVAGGLGSSGLPNGLLRVRG